MICNICTKDKRCFVLSETEGPPFRPEGMRFRLCVDCLKNALKHVWTANSTIENPDDFPLPAPTINKINARDADRIASAAEAVAAQTPVIKVKP